MSLDILLIEPDIILSDIYYKALVKEGYSVNSAVNAAIALSQMEYSKPDIIILEPQLAKHGGFEFLYELRSYADWQHIPVILHTFIPPKIFIPMEKALSQLGVVAILYKPQTQITNLIGTIEDLLVRENA